MIATIGIDLQSGQPRYTFGVPELQDGVGFIVVVVGLFAIAEVLRGMEEHASRARRRDRSSSRASCGSRARSGSARSGRSGAAASSASSSACCRAPAARSRRILSYTSEKRLSKHPEEFGKGAIEGVAGPEAANNADTAGAMVPLLTLGIPGGGATAVMLGAFIMYGIQPGPLLFQNRPGPGLGPDRQHVHRQRHAADPEPAADRPVRAPALHPDRHPVCR